MGLGVGKSEMGYLFGQYKRINTKYGAEGRSFLSGDFPEVRMVHGWVHVLMSLCIDS
jgi:hypothetical protein